jgi:hypothetical protein
MASPLSRKRRFALGATELGVITALRAVLTVRVKHFKPCIQPVGLSNKALKQTLASKHLPKFNFTNKTSFEVKLRNFGAV